MDELEKNRLEDIKRRESKATKQPWGPYKANLPFYAILEKPSSSLSKHDSERPDYWKVDDAIFVANARADIPWLVKLVEKLEKENIELKSNK